MCLINEWKTAKSEALNLNGQRTLTVKSGKPWNTMEINNIQVSIMFPVDSV